MADATVGRIVLILRAVLNCVLVVVFFGLSLFIPAGTLRFWNAWLFLGLFDASFLTILVYLIFRNPEYAEKRFRGNETERPQRTIMSLLVTSAIASLIVAGLDHRFYWSMVPLAVILLSAALIVAGFVMLFFVMRQNSYASRVVEIQDGQKVIDNGLYAVVRHPMYLAFSVIFVLAPILLGSWYAVAPAVLIPVLLTFRIRNEEQLLLKGLEGYKAYQKNVRYRLVPFVW
jgi:protein-S-isoprenylcysteine O-methyltransferase Ste14